MINSIQLLRNIGLFDSVSSGANIPLSRLSMVYAENGRGKTTLAAILRSLGSGDPLPIAERRRLAAQHPPHIVLACDGGPPPAMFQNGIWNRKLNNLAIFDDVFVDENIHSGLAVGAGHRQRLHELILGAQAVALNQQLQQLIFQVETHNSELRIRAAAIPVSERDGFSVEEFCAIPPREDIDTAIESTERSLAALREQEPVKITPAFEPLELPAFDVPQLESILQASLANLETTAVASVQAHLAHLRPGSERWISEGMNLLPAPNTQTGHPNCPFCAQDLSASPVINHYREYFGSAYSNLKRRISEALQALNRAHGGDRPAVFERTVRVVVERRQFWARFGDMPEIGIDTARIGQTWTTARTAIEALLLAKQASPLEQLSIPDETRASLRNYEESRTEVSALSTSLQNANRTIATVKEQAASSSVSVLNSDLSRLRPVRTRHMPAMIARCNRYLEESAAKTATEGQRDQARNALETYRTTVFAGYEMAVNLYLQRFNAGFRLGSVSSANTRGGPSCTYNVVINNVPIAIASDTTAGQPSFRSTLSSGDRNTLALAFFFASLDQDPTLADKIVVIDDPISSLDDHRSLTTIQEIRRLAERVAQVIVLSHNKIFLSRIWESTGRDFRAAIQVERDSSGSILRPWNVDRDCITEYDRRHVMLREYLTGTASNTREVAKAIRPLLEGFLRVACPETFPPGALLGPFLNRCEQRLGSPQRLLDQDATRELHDLVEYANKFHHDTNDAFETEYINDGELQGFVRRALAFARR